MARPPKPKEAKILAGTFRKDREPVDDPMEAKPVKKVPAPPLSLQGHPRAVGKWQEVAGLLIESDVLKLTDLDVLESYCIAWLTMVDASDEVRREGLTVDGAMGGVQKNPACTVLAQAQAEHRQLSTLLGLNPSARTRINVGKKETFPKGLGALRKPPKS